MAIKAFLMQNLSLIALLVLEIWCHKISLGRREQVMKFGYLPPENELNFKKMSFYVQNRSSRPKIDPPSMSISTIFKHRKNVSFSKFLGRLDEKRAAATPWLTNFAKMWPKGVSRIKLKVTKFGHHRIRGFWLAAVSLAIRACEPPPPGLIGLKQVQTHHWRQKEYG